jgi:hypothetical protein
MGFPPFFMLRLPSFLPLCTPCNNTTIVHLYLASQYCTVTTVLYGCCSFLGSPRINPTGCCTVYELTVRMLDKQQFSLTVFWCVIGLYMYFFLFQYWIPTHNKLRVVGKATVLPYSFLVRYWILHYYSPPLQFLGALLDLTLPLLD